MTLPPQSDKPPSRALTPAAVEAAPVTGGMRPARAVFSGRPGVYVPVDVLLARMRRTAARELARHVLKDAQRCGCCGEIWPCTRARQADMALS
jgi:hypothetical protein